LGPGQCNRTQPLVSNNRNQPIYIDLNSIQNETKKTESVSEASGESSPGIPPLRFLEQARIKNLEDKIKTLELQQEHAKTSIELL
jgi:hypothetical protein